MCLRKKLSTKTIWHLSCFRIASFLTPLVVSATYLINKPWLLKRPPKFGAKHMKGLLVELGIYKPYWSGLVRPYGQYALNCHSG